MEKNLESLLSCARNPFLHVSPHAMSNNVAGDEDS